jgi:hypothetical protein
VESKIAREIITDWRLLHKDIRSPVVTLNIKNAANGTGTTYLFINRLSTDLCLTDNFSNT